MIRHVSAERLRWSRDFWGPRSEAINFVRGSIRIHSENAAKTFSIRHSLERAWLVEWETWISRAANGGSAS